MPSAAALKVDVQSQGANTSRIQMQTEIRAPREKVWKLLTDYDHHVGFLPYMSKSHSLTPKQTTATGLTTQTVAQEGTINVLFWKFRMAVTQRVIEQAPTQMKFEAIAGDFRVLKGTWTVLHGKEGTLLGCDFVVQPKRQVPFWAIRFVARRYLTRMIGALQTGAEQR
jgi:ribosome-associated toxin RatA of RatAB toxin-antitoxin module